MKKIFSAIACSFLLVGCALKEQPKLRLVDEKTFYINGVDARDGHDAVAKSLIADGFEIYYTNKFDLDIKKR